MLLGFSVPMLLMVAIAFIVSNNIAKMVKTSDWVRHTQEVIAKSRELEKLVVDMETGVRGFLITGEERFLEPYNNALGIWDDKITSLKNQVSDNPEQVLLLEEVDTIAKRWIKNVARPEIAARIEVATLGSTMDNVIALVSAKTGKRIIDKTRMKFNTFITTETELMNVRYVKADKASSYTYIVTILGTALSIILALFAAFRISDNIAGGINLLVDKTEEFSSGKLNKKISVKSDDEVGTLANAFNNMSQKLSEREDALRESEQKYRSLAQELDAEREQLLVTLTSIGDGVIVTNTDGKVKIINPVAEILTGWTQSEAFNKPASEVFHIINEQSRKPLENPVEKVLQYNRVIGLANDTVLIAKDGTERIIADSGAPIHNAAGAVLGVVLVFRDETQKTESERQLRQVQKMESIGTLAGGVAHEFNNILGGMLGYTEIAKDDISCDSPAQESLDEILALGARARDIVRQILAFSRKDRQEKKSVKMPHLINEELKVLRATIPSSIEIRHDIDENSGTVWGDKTQIQQVVMNLCNNAVQALQDGSGMIEVKLSPFVLDAEHVRVITESCV